jgi:beta-lactamase class C
MTEFTRRGFLFSAAAALDSYAPAEAIISGAVGNGRLESAVLRVESRGKVYEKAFGKARVDSPFLIASITKPMTATASMILCERGKLSLDDLASKHLPGVDKRLTLRHLLTHTSGLPDMLPDNDDLRKRNAPLSEFVKGAMTVPLAFAPGSKVQYQSMGILLAAEIVERISKRPLRKFLHDELFKPLGMSRTALGMGNYKMSDVVRSQVDPTPESRHWDWNSPYWRDLGAPWGGAHSTAADIAAFLRAFAKPSGKPVSKETARMMISNQAAGLKPGWGIGWSVTPKPFGHSGSTGTMSWADVEKDRIFVLLTSLPAAISNKLIIDPVSKLFREGA